MQRSLDDSKRALLHVLRAYCPIDDTERAHLIDTIEVIERPGDCFNRSNMTPGHITGSAFVFDTRNRLLLLSHKKLSRWLQPGGHADKGEYDPLRTAIREVYEETGIQIEYDFAKLCDIDVQKIPRTEREPEHLHFDVRFSYRTSKDLVLISNESHEYRWWDISRITDARPDEGILRVVSKNYASY